MHFSRVKNAEKKDLVLTFDQVIALQWHDEMFGSIFVPRPTLPRIPDAADPLFAGWTYPIIELERSAWIEQIQRVRPHPTPTWRHYFFVAMNDLVDLLAPPPVKVAWFEGIVPWDGC